SHVIAISPQAKHEIDIAAVKILVIAVKTNAIVRAFLHEQRRMCNVTYVPRTQDIIVVTRFLAAKYFLALIIDIDDVAKKRVPVWMFIECLCNFTQRLRSITIICVEDSYDPFGDALDAFVHRMVMTAVFLRDPPQMQEAAQQVDSAIGRTAVDYD